ncbi:MAG TPA: cytochrome c oxidase subunit 3 family protein, partial [Bdellovibrionales bacterium]|nr:cytochrome c oxidase subunit 3 family protein [Bdellovibrionales bacterium]
GHHHAHHFESAEHEYETSKFGMWTFLVTEIMMFGGLFVGYIIYHGMYPAMFHAGSKFLDWKLGALNTVVLLFSSLTMALSIHYAQKNDRAKMLMHLYITLACGFVFLIVKYFEYTHKFHMGLYPGTFFNPTTPEGQAVASQFPNIGQYFSFYFCMTGLYGSHVIVGMSLIAWCIVRGHRGEFGPKYYTPVECVGLFWHLVDLIWIYLFPLLYLVG